MTDRPIEAAAHAWEAPPGWSLHYAPLTGSTNDDARRAALAGCPSGAVFVADAQRHGRGRLGRSWVSAPGTSLLVSLVLRRAIAPIYLTAVCSVSVAEAITAVADLPARIKWPNDVMIRDRKVCGILTEVAARGATPATIVGIGLNVNVDLATAGMPPIATSLAHEAGRWIARPALLYTILERVAAYLTADDDVVPERILARWEGLLWRRHQRVRIDDAGVTLDGVVLGLSAQGALRVASAGGAVHEIALGDVLVP